MSPTFPPKNGFQCDRQWSKVTFYQPRIMIGYYAKISYLGTSCGNRTASGNVVLYRWEMTNKQMLYQQYIPSLLAVIWGLALSTLYHEMIQCENLVFIEGERAQAPVHCFAYFLVLSWFFFRTFPLYSPPLLKLTIFWGWVYLIL